MDQTSGINDLATFEARRSAQGLLHRYALGRLRHFWNRQVLGLFGALVVGLLFSPLQGALVAALILSGEALDCWALRRLTRRHGARLLALASGSVQILSLIAALLLCDRLTAAAEMDFFILALLAGVSVNSGVARPYFPALSDVKLALAGLAGLWVLAGALALPGASPAQSCLLAAAALILAMSVTMFVRQIQRAFAVQMRLERTMALANDDLRGSRADLAKSGEANQRLALAARHANDAIVFLDKDNRYVWVNEAFSQMTGYTPDQAIGRQPGDLLNAAETAPETLEKLAAARQTNTPVRVEIFNRGRDGRGYWVETSIIPILDEAGDLLVSLAVERDITEAKEREADLARARTAAEAAARAKSRFLANMSHEIRTPLNGVIGVAEMLAETRLTALQRGYVETVLESGGALLHMITDILDLSKLQSGKSLVASEVFDLEATLGSVLRLLQPQAVKKGLGLNLRLDPDLALKRGAHWARVTGDPGKVRQILVNLIGNAIKFTETGGVTVEIAARADGLALRVQDSGIGIGPEVLPTIFDSFTQADETITRRFGGTGLGLTISVMLARQMGGTIEAESTPGQGSAFTLTLPLPGAGLAHSAPAPAPTPAHLAPASHATSALSILVAEDNRTNMMILRKALDGQIARMIEAPDGSAAVRAWAREVPDLILMDVSMPVMDGLSAVQEIRRQESLTGRPRCPILALTASSHLEDREACLAAGFDGYLVKPLRRDDLLRAIAGQIAAPPALPASAPPAHAAAQS